jgi:hypothetical protein
MAWRTATWQRLAEHKKQVQAVHLRQLFADDPQRFERMHLQLDEVLVDRWMDECLLPARCCSRLSLSFESMTVLRQAVLGSVQYDLLLVTCKWK